MGKPFGLLNRIFSFSKASKRNGSNFDQLNPTEYGQEHDIHNPDETLHLTGSVRTTGGIGGLGKGITNAASEVGRSNTRLADEKGAGLRKRLLRRASMSASDLLSWGYEKTAKHESQITAEGALQKHRTRPLNKEPDPNTILDETIEKPHHEHHEPARHGQKNNISQYNDRVIKGLALSNGSGGRGKRGDQSLPTRPQDSEELTRLLRTSSSNYRVIRETDYRDMDPLEHPINAISLLRSPSIPLLSSSSTQSTGPSAWPPPLQTPSLAFPSSQHPLVHTHSTSSTTSTSTYKVTVYRRRIHSRTSFPEANRALDHLHSSSPMATSSTPNSSPRSSVDRSEPPPTDITPRVAPVRPSGIPKMHNRVGVARAIDVSLDMSAPSNQKKQPPPSMLPKRSSKRRPSDQYPTHEEAALRRGINSQLHPVAPLRTVPPISHRSTSVFLESSHLDKDRAQVRAEKPSIKLLSSQSGRSSQISMVDNAVRYTTPLKGSEISLANEEAYDGVMVENAEQTGSYHKTSPAHSAMNQSSINKTPGKTRNVLRKKRREIQVDISPPGDVSGSRKSTIGAESRNGSRSNLQTVLGVLQTMGGVVERLHGSAVGEDPLNVLPRQYSDEWDIVSPNELPTTPAVGKYQIASSLDIRKVHSIGHSGLGRPVTPSSCRPLVPETPRDRDRLARLRRDPSVVSLLEMYKADGTLKESAFLNTPPGKPLQRTASERIFKSVGRTGMSTDPNNRSIGKREANKESRSDQMRRVYVNALDESPIGNAICSLRTERPQVLATPTLEPPQPNASLTDHLTTPYLQPSSPKTPSKVMSQSHQIHSKLYAREEDISESSIADVRLDISSLFSDKERSSRMIDISLFVEPGSLNRSDDASCKSSPALETPAEEQLQPAQPLPQEHRYQIDLQRKTSSTEDEFIPRSPNRRASEVFAFLDTHSSGESDETGPIRSGIKVGTMNLTKGVTQDLHQSSLMPVNSQMSPAVPPSKRPLGPRIATKHLSSHTPTRDKCPPSRFASSNMALQVLPSSLPLSSVTSSQPDSTEPLTGATFASDSFASQNTTDRSLYRGIYKILNDTAPTSGHIKLKQTKNKEARTEFPILSPSKERNPFLVDSVDVDKSLPIIPSTQSDSDSESCESSKRPTRDIVLLPTIVPLSPLIAELVSTNTPLKRSDSHTPHSPRLPKSSVKDKIAMWESTKPLDIDRSDIQRRTSSRTSHAGPNGKSVRWSEDTSSTNRSGLGDGRVFNVSQTTGRMYGPRAPSPVKRPTNKSVSQRTPTAFAKASKSVDLTQHYPFSQELFPAILSPGGPAVAKPNSLLHTPQRNVGHNDPSPASSSKLGAYGREIMALARSKSGARTNHSDSKIL